MVDRPMRASERRPAAPPTARGTARPRRAALRGGDRVLARLLQPRPVDEADLDRVDGQLGVAAQQAGEPLGERPTWRRRRASLPAARASSARGTARERYAAAPRMAVAPRPGAVPSTGRCSSRPSPGPTTSGGSPTPSSAPSPSRSASSSSTPSPAPAATWGPTSAPSSSPSPSTGSSTRPATSSCGTPATRPTSTRSSPAGATTSSTSARPAACRATRTASESEHDWIENSHASTIVSYAHGLATALEMGATPADDRGVEPAPTAGSSPIIGDGSMTGGMAFEGLNNLGHSGRKAIIILNDNGRSYAPTVSKLTESVARLRINPQLPPPAGPPRAAHRPHADVRASSTRASRPPPPPCASTSSRGRSSRTSASATPARSTATTSRASSGRCATPPTTTARSSSTSLTQKGRGYAPAETDDVKRLHDIGRRAGATSQAGQLHRGVHRGHLQGRRGATPSWSPSPRPCPTPPACCPSASGSPAG